MKTETGIFDVYKHEKGATNCVLSGEFAGTITWEKNLEPAVTMTGTWRNHDPEVPTRSLCIDESRLHPNKIFCLFYHK
jgi:hypothetical protein